jgi:riboflavin kinase / FMN adenylyltransferase
MKPVTLSGEVAHFRGNGRRLGYPTANITTATTLAEGIYFGFADLASFKQRPALIFIGVPTTMGDPERRIEVHVLDIPDVDYYSQTVTATLYYFHRPNQRFRSVEELITAMSSDEKQARQWFTKNPLAKLTDVNDT